MPSIQLVFHHSAPSQIMPKPRRRRIAQFIHIGAHFGADRRCQDRLSRAQLIDQQTAGEFNAMHVLHLTGLKKN